MRFLATFLSIFSLFFFLLLISCGSNKKSPPYQGYSRSIKESKEKGVFEFQVATYKSNLMLDSGHTLKIKNAWVENQWWGQVYLIGATSINKEENSHQLILIYNIIKSPGQKSPEYYYFVGNKPIDDSLVRYSCEQMDSIKIPLYREIYPIFPSKKNKKAFDSLTFIKSQ